VREVRVLVKPHDENNVEWQEAGKWATVIGPAHCVGREEWFPVVFDGESVPDWVLSRAVSSAADVWSNKR
jgi:hypothetical protein